MRHKFNAKPTVKNGLKFPSKAEARRYDQLMAMKVLGHISFFLRQVPFDLPGGITYRADFLIFWSDGTCTVEDVKGYETQEFKIKRKLLESTYPIELEIVK